MWLPVQYAAAPIDHKRRVSREAQHVQLFSENRPGHSGKSIDRIAICYYLNHQARYMTFAIRVTVADNEFEGGIVAA
jgi:hypothetical protein